MPHELVVDDQDIAIIGMTGRFPGAQDLAAFWRNVCQGVESIRPVGDAELEALGVDAATRADPGHVKASAALEGMELFDAGFFGFTPREAELTDPQHRIFLECCWEALEHAGYVSEGFDGAIGVFGGAPTNTYLLYNLVPNADALSALDQVQIDVSNGADFLGTRVAYKLNLRGPSYTVLSACSTSLVAAHLACQSLLNEECDLALAGGVSIHVKHPEGYRFVEGGIVSPDGHCRAFDASANGTVFGSGAGVVVLKRLKDALEDGDHVHAVIKGSAINNDGAAKVGYTAPSVEGQAAVISEALGAAGVKPDTIGYVETHGTGTKMGDPIEVRALTRAFRPRAPAQGAPRDRIPLGSLKANIGHLANASGVASLIKAVLAVEHRRIPPSLHFEKPSPEIDFGDFYVNTGLAEWPANPRFPRRAGVSSFGVGGTNAHVILEEAPARPASGPARAAQVLVLSAKTATALEAATDRLARHLQSKPEMSLADAAYTLQVGRQAMAHRRVLVCGGGQEAARALGSRDAARVWTESAPVQDRPVAFLFPGQGAQYVNMARGLYDAEPTFREHLDACAQQLAPHLGLDLRAVLYPEAGGEEAATRALSQTGLTQPALFAVEYALARLWLSWGVRPRAMLGHSIGEYVAACLAGVFSLPDALALVAARGKLMQALPAGAMLAVPLSEEELRPHLGAGLSVAAVNGPALTVVAGPEAAIEALRQTLEARRLDVHRLHTSHAFHSAMMDPILAPFTERVRQVKLSAPRLPFLSNVTGTWIDEKQAVDPAYWATHLRQAVRFSDGVKTLLQQPQQLLLEVGPGTSLGTLAKQHPDRAGRVVLASTRYPREPASDVPVLLGTLGRLWLSGAAVDWKGFHAHAQRRRLPLPTYPFERQRYWIDARPLVSAPRPPPKLEKQRELADWFYAPSWKRAPSRATQAPSAAGWLLFMDRHGVGDALAQRLVQAGQRVTRVVHGAELARRADGVYALDARKREDYAALLRDMKARGEDFDRVVHLWSLSAEPPSLEQALESGFYSLLFLAQALGQEGRTAPLQWWIAANGLFKVESADAPIPEKATLLGPCRVVPQESPDIACHVVDVALGGDAAAVAGALLAELQAGASEPVVALRGRQRWVQTFEPLPLQADGAPARALREGGAYLVTEGLSGIGWALASHLARTCRARLALVEGPEFPARQQWTRWLETHAPGDAVSLRIRNAQALEAAGTQVLLLAAELPDEAQLRRVVAQAVEHFGRLDGVLHAAGGMRDAALGPVQELGPRECAAHFRHQILGAQSLAKALPAEGLDFCLLTSSLSAVLGGFGQAAHAASSQFLDAFAEHRTERGATPWISVGWDAWRLEDEASLAALSPALAQLAMSPEEGVEAARRILTQSTGGHLVVSTGALDARRRQGPAAPAAPAPAGKEGLSGHARPALGTPYLAPRNELERTIARVWQQVLGIEQLGVNDHFFELGGHSLLATQLRNQLYAAFKVDLPLRSLFEVPTVAGIAARIEKELQQSAAVEEKPIRERLRAAFPTERAGLLEDYLKREIAKALDRPVEQLPAGGALAGLDLDLLGAEVEYALRQDFKLQLYPHELREHATVAELARYLLAEMDRLANPAKFVDDKPLSSYALKPYRKHTTVGAAQRPAKKNAQALFVHSSPRSGSTLLRVMLAGHPRLFCPPEVNLLFFENMREWRENIGFGSEMEWTTGGLQWAFMELLGLESSAGQALIDKLVAENVSAQEVYARLQAGCAPRLLVDKTPTYSLDLATLERAEALFENAKYLYLFRHPYPVMESILRVRFDRLFGPGLFGTPDVDPYVVAETVWALSNRNLLAFFDRIGPERAHWIRYEDLVRDPHAVMGGVCQFLGIPFDERVLTPYDGKRDRMITGLGDPNILQHKTIEKDLGESWKKIKWPRPLDPSTREVVERLGYALPDAPPAPRREVPAASSGAEAEQLLANLDQLSDEQVAALLEKLSKEEERS